MEHKRIKQMVSGASSGIITKTFLAPLDRIKIMYQLNGMRETQKLPNFFKIFQKIVDTEGFIGLYKGNGTNVIRVFPNAAIKFTLFEYFREKFAKTGKLDFSKYLLSSSLSGFIQITATYPLDFCRTRLTLSKSIHSISYTGIINCLMDTIKKEGYFAVYKGLSASLFTGVPFIALKLSSYEILKEFFGNECEIKTKLICGTLAGFIAQTATYPGDTLRRRMKINGINGESLKYKNTIHAIQEIVIKENGIKGFYKGYKINTLTIVPGVACQLTLYDLFSNYLKNK